MNDKSRGAKIGCGGRPSAVLSKSWNVRVGAHQAAILAMAFAGLSLGLVDRAAAQEQPPGCTFAGAGASMSRTPATNVLHGQEICYRIVYSNSPGAINCDILNFDASLILPNGTSIPMLAGASIPSGDSVACPSGDPRCVTPSNCGIGGGVTGYSYIAAHADEVFDFSGCPPTTVGDAGKLVAYTEGLGDSLTNPPDIAAACATANNNVPHACCAPCTGTCTNVNSPKDCTFPSTYVEDKTCNETPCSPTVCPPDADLCDVEECDAADGLCKSRPNVDCPPDANLCNVEACDPVDGLCKSGPSTVCPPDANFCNVEACDPVDGLCKSGPSTVCPPDANLCNAEACDTADGLCKSGPVTVCPDPICETCNPLSGVCEPNGNPACQNEGICRTPGFWGTHANNTKRNSQNITQAVIDACGGVLDICGECISTTVPVNDAASAVEALCVSPKGAIVLQNARQLTALALNCCISGFGADCGDDGYLSGLLDDCNNACLGLASTRTNAECRDEIDCYNNGGQFNPVTTGTATCGDGGPDNCHTRQLVNEDLGLDFNPPGPAGSSDDCHAAHGNHCAILDLPNCSEKNQQGEDCCGTDSLDTCAPECTGATCTTFIPCNPGTTCSLPVCATTAEGGGVCLEGTTPCVGLAPCVTTADCLDGVCAVETCCGTPVCVPTAAFCPKRRRCGGSPRELGNRTDDRRAVAQGK